MNLFRTYVAPPTVGCGVAHLQIHYYSQSLCPHLPHALKKTESFLSVKI